MVPTAVVVAPVPVQDSENNNTTTNININYSDNDNNNATPVVVTQMDQPEVTIEKPMTPPPESKQQQQQQIPNQVSDINDTNNNNYQKQPEAEADVPVGPEKNENDEPDRAAPVPSTDAQPQDTNNNSQETDEKSSTAAIIEALIQYGDDQWSPANVQGKKYYTRDQLLKLKEASAVAPIELPENVSNTLSRSNKDSLNDTLNQQLGVRNPYDALVPKWTTPSGGMGRNPYPPKRPSQQGNKQGVSWIRFMFLFTGLILRLKRPDLWFNLGIKLNWFHINPRT